MMRVLIACEESGVMRRAFAALGHDAWSCDLLPARDGSANHIQGDVREILGHGWDLMIARPPCTILCNSGVKHLYLGGRKENGRDEDRWAEMDEAAALYRDLRDAKCIPKRAIENPIMHGHGIAAVKRGRVQFVQPWWFGDPYFKATGFELIGLADLVPTNKLTPPKPGTDEHKRWSKVHRAPPGPNRARDRSETFPGIATAGAARWGATERNNQ